MILINSPATREQAKQIIAAGGCIAFRTDTFYGLGVDPFNRRAVQRLRTLKNREADKPILVVVSDREQIKRLIVDDSNLFQLIAERFWPGALTIIGRASAILPDELTAGTGTLGVRLPDDAEVRALIRVCGGGVLTATSANPVGEPPARSASEVACYFSDKADLKLIVDSSAASADKPSTIIDVSKSENTKEVRLIRCGALAVEVLEETLRAMNLKLKIHD